MAGKYHIITFGCQMNYADSRRIASVLEAAGLEPTKTENSADFIVINMCSVRQPAVDRVFGLAQKIKKGKKKPVAILTGCTSKNDRKKFEKLYDFVLGIKTLPEWPAILGIGKPMACQSYLNLKLAKSGLTAFVPIMTGCNNFCAYCIVPFARGREISRPAKEVIAEVKTMVKSGAKEVWLLGQNVNSYHSGKTDFPGLLMLVDKIPGDFWIRFTSSHPKDFSNKMIKAMAGCRKLPKYLNLPIQAGSDKILKAMNRPYTVKQYIHLIKKTRKAMPGISISTDIIVGFPGETQTDFKGSFDVFKKVGFDMAYINKFSPRPGTAAARMKDNVPREEKSRREKVLTKILAQTALENNKKLVGKTIPALMFGNGKTKNIWIGKTGGNKTIHVQSPANLAGKLVIVKIIEAKPWGLSGKL